MTQKITDLPHVRMFQRELMTALPLTAWESLEHALDTGAEWWKGTTLHGASIMVRCASINDLHLMTADALATIARERSDDWQDS